MTIYHGIILIPLCYVLDKFCYKPLVGVIFHSNSALFYYQVYDVHKGGVGHFSAA